MGSNILTSDVGTEDLIPVPLAIKDETCLSLVPCGSVLPCPEEDPELKRHIEARQAIGCVQRCSRQIVDAKPALANDCEKLVNSYLTAIVGLIVANVPATMSLGSAGSAATSIEISAPSAAPRAKYKKIFTT